MRVACEMSIAATQVLADLEAESRLCAICQMDRVPVPAWKELINVALGGSGSARAITLISRSFLEGLLCIFILQSFALQPQERDHLR